MDLIDALYTPDPAASSWISTMGRPEDYDVEDIQEYFEAVRADADLDS